MLISWNEVKQHCPDIRGVLHVGAHTGEEAEFYGNIPTLWVEGNEQLATDLQEKGYNVIHAVVSDKLEEVDFLITNNKASSSILPLGTHATNYPNIVVDRIEKVLAYPLGKIVEHQACYNFLNLDIQGAELKALKGYDLRYVDYIYSEVNIEEVYRGCANMVDMDEYLIERGFKRILTKIVRQGWGDALYVKDANEPIKLPKLNVSNHE